VIRELERVVDPLFAQVSDWIEPWTKSAGCELAWQ
jgi:hypothetical protein